MNILVIQQVVISLFLIIWTTFFLIRYFLDRNARAHHIIRNLLISVFIAAITPLSYRLAPVLWPLNIISEFALLCSFLLTYIASDQLLNNKLAQSMFRHRLFPIIVGISLISFFLLWWHHMAEPTIFSSAEKKTWQHSAFYLLKDGTEIGFCVIIAYLYWRSLRDYINLTYFVRRGICMIGFLSGIPYILVIDYPIVSSLLTGTSTTPVLVQFLLPLQQLPLLVLAIGFMTPNKVFAVALYPLEYFIKQQQFKKQHLLYYLHGQMLIVVPYVQMFEESLKDLRILIEIRDARQIIWSNMLSEGIVSPEIEAEQLFRLIKDQTVFHETGPYQPPELLQKNILNHDLKVAAKLRTLQQESGKSFHP